MRTCPWRGSWNGSVSSLQRSLTRIELILNRLRWKYLQAIAMSPALRERPTRAISLAFNQAFLSLAGLEQAAHWRDLGFDARARYELDWDQEREDLTSALGELTRCQDATTTYGEALALKPGFHEAWVHAAFPDDAQEDPDTPRGRAFAILRGSQLGLIDLAGGYPADLSDPCCFLGYAPCAVTEGPFVRRRGMGVSYFADLKRVGTIPSIAARRSILHESFQVLDAYQRLRDEDSAIGLTRLIEETEAFVHDPSCSGPPASRL